MRQMFTSELLLPVHLIKEVFCPQEEVVDLAALLVSLCGVVDAELRLCGQELADVWHGEHDLLHGAVLAHNLNSDGDIFFGFFLFTFTIISIIILHVCVSVS